jgi:hypothetical protein
VTDAEAGISDTDVTGQRADEISSSSKYNELFNNSHLATSQFGLSIVMMMYELQLLDIAWTNQLWFASPFLPMKNLWEWVSNVTAASENQRIVKKWNIAGWTIP